VAKSIGDNFRWHHLALMGVAFLINLMGVLWVYQFDPDHLNGWTWVRF
jgi:hypothetical protein